MEKKVMHNFPAFMNLDLANIVGSFLKLFYVPRDILNEINQQQTLTFNKYSCLVILENLVSVGYDENTELYDKLFNQLQKTSANMNTKLVARAINILLKYKEIFKNDKARGEDIAERT